MLETSRKFWKDLLRSVSYTSLLVMPAAETCLLLFSVQDFSVLILLL